MKAESKASDAAALLPVDVVSSGFRVASRLFTWVNTTPATSLWSILRPVAFEEIRPLKWDKLS